MAIRFRKGRKTPWQVYWNNPITGKRESATYATKRESKKEDSLIKRRLEFDRKSFRNEEEESEAQTVTLEACYLEYLKQKKFSKKGISWQMDAMRVPLRKLGKTSVAEITKQDLAPLIEKMLATKVKAVTVRNRFSVLRTVLKWCAEQGYREPVQFPKLPPAVYEMLIPPSADTSIT